MMRNEEAYNEESVKGHIKKKTSVSSWFQSRIETQSLLRCTKSMELSADQNIFSMGVRPLQLFWSLSIIA